MPPKNPKTTKTTKGSKKPPKPKKHLISMHGTSGEDSGSESMLTQQHHRYREEEGEEDIQATLPIQASQLPMRRKA